MGASSFRSALRESGHAISKPRVYDSVPIVPKGLIAGNGHVPSVRSIPPCTVARPTSYGIQKWACHNKPYM